MIRGTANSLKTERGGRYGSAVKCTHYTSRGPGFNSQHPHGSSQLPVTLVSGDLTPSHRHACRQITNVHKIQIKS